MQRYKNYRGEANEKPLLFRRNHDIYQAERLHSGCLCSTFTRIKRYAANVK